MLADCFTSVWELLQICENALCSIPPRRAVKSSAPVQGHLLDEVDHRVQPVRRLMTELVFCIRLLASMRCYKAACALVLRPLHAVQVAASAQKLRELADAVVREEIEHHRTLLSKTAWCCSGDSSADHTSGVRTRKSGVSEIAEAQAHSGNCDEIVITHRQHYAASRAHRTRVRERRSFQARSNKGFVCYRALAAPRRQIAAWWSFGKSRTRIFCEHMGERPGRLHISSFAEEQIRQVSSQLRRHCLRYQGR